MRDVGDSVRRVERKQVPMMRVFQVDGRICGKRERIGDIARDARTVALVFVFNIVVVRARAAPPVRESAQVLRRISSACVRQGRRARRRQPQHTGRRGDPRPRDWEQLA